jgi:hypothetical protein
MTISNRILLVYNETQNIWHVGGSFMWGRVFISGVLFLYILTLPGLALGAEKFGVIFDIKGNALLRTTDGDVTELKRSRHILHSVEVGDTIEVNGAGRVLVVSIKDRKGYELLSDSKLEVQSDGIERVKGTVNMKEGYNVPSGRARGDIGGIVVRDAIRDICIKSLLPINTSVLTLTPTLKWKNTCEGTKMFTVMVLKERNVIFEEITDKSSVTIPAGLLKEDQTYRWLIDGGPSSAILGGTIHTLDKNLADMISQQKASFAQQNIELPERLSFLFLLIDQNLVELSEAEIEKLKVDYPDNAFIRELK